MMANIHILGFGELIFLFVLLVIWFIHKTASAVLQEALRNMRRALDQIGFDAGQNLGGTYGKPIAEALTTENQTVEICDPDVRHARTQKTKNVSFRKWYFIAAGIVFCLLAYGLLKLMLSSK